MSDTPVTPPKTSRWVKILLAVSLALNVGIAGIFAGAILRAPSVRTQAAPPDGISIIARAMPPKYQRQLRENLRNQREDLRPDRAALRNLRNRLVRALQAEPFEIAEVEAVFIDQRAMLDSILATGHAELLKQISHMDKQERNRFIRNLMGHEARTAPATVNQP